MTETALTATLARRNTGRPPVWFMRQAGRYHAHYQSLKRYADFITLCKDPKLATEVAMGPVHEFNFDAAILFSDLLFPLEAMGMGLTLGVLYVFFRDVGQLTAVVLQFWFWATPVVYPLNILPTVFQELVSYNPMTHLLAAYQTILVTGQWPDWQSLWSVAVLAVLFCASGIYLFRRHAGEMADEL